MTYKTTDKKIANIAKITDKKLEHHYSCQINNVDSNLLNDKIKILTNATFLIKKSQKKIKNLKNK